MKGTFKINRKYDNKAMRGKNPNGSTYHKPHVYHINFFHKNYAIHGNYWVPLSHFGHINSSHGCIGLANHEAEWLYTWAPIGTPVFVYS